MEDVPMVIAHNNLESEVKTEEVRKNTHSAISYMRVMMSCH